MKVLIPILIGLLVVGCGKKVGVKDIDNEMMKQAMQWDADIKVLKLEVEHLKADVKYERELRLKGADYHKPKDYHSRFKLMMGVVRNEKKLTDLFDIVAEAQKRLKDE